MSLDLLDAVRKFAVRHVPGYKMMLRIGMHTGTKPSMMHTTHRYKTFHETIINSFKYCAVSKAIQSLINNKNLNATLNLWPRV